MAHRNKDAVEMYRKAGYRVELSDGQHWKVYDRNGVWVDTLSMSTSDVRAIRGARAQLRRLQRGDYSRVPGMREADRDRPEPQEEVKEKETGRVPSAFRPREKLPTAAAVKVNAPKASNWTPGIRDKSAENYARNQKREVPDDVIGAALMAKVVSCMFCGREVMGRDVYLYVLFARNRRDIREFLHWSRLSLTRPVNTDLGWCVFFWFCRDHAPKAARPLVHVPGKGFRPASGILEDPKKLGLEIREMLDDFDRATFDHREI